MDCSVILSAIIQAAGTVLAAFIAGGFIKKSVDSYFLSYSDKSFQRQNVIKEAQSDIFIAVGVGNNFFKEYGDDIEDKLKSGLHVRYMLLDQGRFNELEWYLHGNFAKDISVHTAKAAKLTQLKEKYPTLFEFRFFHEYMTASYICADIWPSLSQKSGLIQIMLYQYTIRPRLSPIMYINPEAQGERFVATVNSLKNMWQKSDHSPYRKEPIRIHVPGKV